MKSLKRMTHLCLLLPILLILTLPSNLFSSDDIEQIKLAIAEKGANWTPGESWVSKLSLEEFKRLCGADLGPLDESRETLISLPQVDDFPPRIDWRNNNGNWVTPPKTQYSPQRCGSCWDFAAVAQVESWWKIYHNNADSMIDLSEQFILSCSGAGSCEGGNSKLALDFIRTDGIPSEMCMPYQANDQIPCTELCSNWMDEAVRIAGCGFVCLNDGLISNIKNALIYQPVSAGFAVYDDFRYYSTGVYEHVSGELISGHAILIIGWNDEEQCWICKNSWGTNWGETAQFKRYTPGANNGGYFRIKWGTCRIGRHSSFIWDETTCGPALSIFPKQISDALVIGDSVSQQIHIKNNSPNQLAFFALDGATSTAIYFHSDSTQSYDGLSWWCGDPQLSGYGDCWLQYLDLPMLTLSNTTIPTLSLIGRWALEDPTLLSPVLKIYDGWDGCNVWISTDGGIHFELAYPSHPAYNCQSLWSFGSPTLWDIGTGIAGWAGRSSGWVPIEFDLSAYKSDSVMIRFALASDEGVSAVTDPSLDGFLIDDIVVSDQGNVLFSNHGEDDPSLRRIGYVGMEDADWIDLPYSMESISPYDSLLLDFNILTRDLHSGHHRGFIFISSNDTSATSSGRVWYDLELILPDYDAAAQRVHLSVDSIPLFVPIIPGAEILNCGQHNGADFDVACTILCNGQALYADTTHVPLLLVDQTSVVEFKLFVAYQQENLDFVITVLNYPGDYNAYNNMSQRAVDVTNLVDDFSKDVGYWSFDGGWAVTTTFVGHSGKSAAHNHNGVTPYENNMDAVMSFIPGFHFQSGDSATLKYWTRYLTEKDKDICYVEASGDSLNWMKIDSLSGAMQKWEHRQVSLTEFIEEGHTQVWVRFHFISDEQNTDLGVLIDDVKIYQGEPLPTRVQNIVQHISTDYNLRQNYPNPFNPSTTIEFSLPEESFVTLKIYNLLGEEVALLISEKRTAGMHRIVWDAKGFASGIYVYRLEAGGNVYIRKLVLMR
ncbi:T9SS type A sorting domain-containing protein [candidate division KSB1 bacterium]|nr:T9SS type A sorting domain-containing protein [candidate division KSB1 bacterium]